MRQFFVSASLLAVCSCSGSDLNPQKAHREASHTDLEVVARLKEIPGNIAVCPNGRKFLSVHPMADSARKVFELRADGTTSAFPDLAWSQAPRFGSAKGINSIIALECTPDNVVWMLDMGGKNALPRFVVWDLKTDSLVKAYTFSPGVVRENSFFQDFALDTKRGLAVVADMTMAATPAESSPALVVLDVKTGASKRLLERHPAVMAEDTPLLVQGKKIERVNEAGDIVNTTLGLNPIAVSLDQQQLLFAAMQGKTIYSLPLDELETLFRTDKGELSPKIYGQKAPSDGMTIDSLGNVYSADIVHGAVGLIEPNGSYSFYILAPEILSWPDGFSHGSDGYIYLTVNQLNLLPALNGGKDDTKAPYLLVRFKPLGGLAAGH